MCDDGDPCTDDTCVPGVGCENTPKTGIDSVTCTCAAIAPATCNGQVIPKSVQRYATRACRLFTQADGAPARRARRRLRQGARALRRAGAVASHAQLRGLSPECAASLVDQYRVAGDRASFLASQF